LTHYLTHYPRIASIRRAALAAVCCCRWLYKCSRHAQLGVSEQRRHFDQLDTGRDQQAGR
jgi:hypothetical protein